MKKYYSLLLAFLVAVSSLFVSCGENDNDNELSSIICKITVKSDGDGIVSITNYIGTSVNALIGNQVEVVATPAAGSAFTGWYVPGPDAPVSNDERFIFTASKNITLVAVFCKSQLLEHQAVDLGLPSGIKWATMNVGATSPEGYGVYYAWGETEKNEAYNWSTYKWCNGSRDTLTKYCTDSSYGTVDNKTVLDPEDDVAHVKWGGSWRMPTKAEQDELRNNCTWTWTIKNGVNGYTVTGPSGNSIFLPAAGHYCGSAYCDPGRGSYGAYWSSSLDSDSSNDACYLNFGGRSYYVCGVYGRCYGRSVRPVSD